MYGKNIRDFVLILQKNHHICDMNMKSFFAAVAAIAVSGAIVPVHGQDTGRLSGSFETNTIWYVDDKVPAPTDRFGSNNYLKLDYSQGNFVAGAQYELYAPVLYGYNPAFKNGKVANKFVGWSDGKYSFTVGDFYEQFGNGLILRSWEDRALVFNNAIEGVRAGYSNDYLTLKFVYGRPRLFMDYADMWMRGADASVNVGALAGMTSHYFALEGSYVSRFMNAWANDATLPVGPNMDMYSGRVVFDADFGFSFKGEYVEKGKDLYEEGGVDGQLKAKRGNAQLIEMSYNNSGLGIFLTGRRLDHMAVKIDPDDTSEANMLNYLPSLTRQYVYSLAMLDPYTTVPGDESARGLGGEQGAQLDVFYTFKRGSALGGKYGTKLHLNAATLYPLEKRGEHMTAFYRDISFDIEKQWNKEFKTTFLYAVQTFSPSKAETRTTEVNNVFVSDMLYKITPRNSVRLELQYLYSKERPNWWAATAEYNMAPKWSFFAGDMYNFDKEKVHYYTAGVSYTESRTRVALSYGRNRAGQVCSGGVCRYMPAFTGGNISVTTSF
jgi:hypothetical protein